MKNKGNKNSKVDVENKDAEIKTEAELVKEEKLTENQSSSGIEETQKIFENSVFTKDQIKKMSDSFLPFGEYIKTSFSVLKANLWKAFLRPAIYSVAIPIAIITLTSILFGSVLTLGSSSIGGVGFLILLVIILLIPLSINFGIRSQLVLKDPNHHFFSKKYAVLPFFWALTGVAGGIYLVTYGAGFFDAIPFVGWIFGIVSSLLIAIFLNNAIYLTIFEDKKPLRNLRKSYELGKDRFVDLIGRNLLILLLPWLLMVVLGIILLIGLVVFSFVFIGIDNANLNTTASIFTILFGGLLLTALITSLGILYTIVVSTLTITNFANLRLAPKPNKTESYYNNYKKTIPTYIVILTIIGCIILGAIGASTNTTSQDLENIFNTENGLNSDDGFRFEVE